MIHRSIAGRPPRTGATGPRAGRVAAVVAATLAAALTGGCGDGGDSGDGLSSLGPAARRGREVAEDRGCTNCHSTDGSASTAPTWDGIWGTTVELDDGHTAVVDRAYVARSIRDPDAQVVDGYSALMPRLDLSQAEIDAVAAYIEALG